MPIMSWARPAGGGAPGVAGAPDGLHPNDEGYAELAERIDGELSHLRL